MSAIRLARAVTGRDRVLKFDGCYHGHSDGLLVGAGSGVATLGIPGSPGVPKAMTELTVQAPFNDLEAVRQAFDRWGRRHRVRDRRAGGGQHGLHPARGRASSRDCAPLCDEHGALLDLRRGHDGIPRGSRRRPATLRSDAGPHVPGQGGGRRPAGGRLRRARRADGPHRARGRRLSGGHALRESAGRGRGTRDPPAARRRRASTRPSTARTAQLATGLAEIAAGRRRALRDVGSRRHVRLLLPPGPGHELSRTRGSPTTAASGGSSRRCSSRGCTWRPRASRRASSLCPPAGGRGPYPRSCRDRHAPSRTHRLRARARPLPRRGRPGSRRRMGRLAPRWEPGRLPTATRPRTGASVRGCPSARGCRGRRRRAPSPPPGP